MKLLAKELKQALQAIIPVLPSMAKAKLTAEKYVWIADGCLHIDDDDKRIKQPLNYKGKAGIAMPAHNVLNSMAFIDLEQEISLSVAGKQFKLSAKDYALQTPSATLVAPNAALPDFKADIDLHLEQFKTAIQSALHSMAKDDVRFYLNGLLFEFKKQQLNIVSTTGHILSKESLHIDADIEGRFIMPRDVVLAIAKMLKNAETVKIGVSDADLTCLSLQIDQTEMVINGIEGRFPAYEGVFPSNATPWFSIRMGDLRKKLQTMRKVVEKASMLRLSTLKQGLELACYNKLDTMQEMALNLALEVKSAHEVHFNPKLLLDATKSIPAAVMVDIFQPNGAPDAAHIFQPQDSTLKEQIVVMPMRP